MNSMAGENVTNDCVWVTKTHYPLSPFNEEVHYASKVILVSRNPLETFPSMCQLLGMASHSLQCNEKLSDFDWWA